MRGGILGNFLVDLIDFVQVDGDILGNFFKLGGFCIATLYAELFTFSWLECLAGCNPISLKADISRDWSIPQHVQCHL